MGDEMSQVIDKVAEKVGIAVEAAGPVAETVIRETVTLGLYRVAIATLGLVVGLLFLRYVLVPAYRKNGEKVSDEFFPLWFVCLIGLVISVVAIFVNVEYVVAPTLTVIESLK